MLYRHKNGLCLTKIEESDLDRLKRLKDESWFGTHKIAVINMSDQRKWFTNTSITVLKAYEDSPNEFIGIFKVDNIDSVNRTCDVGWDIFETMRGKGFGKKLVQAGVDFCFEILNIHRIDAEILANNIASQKCAEAAGFVKEGSRRSAVYKCGNYIDSYIYGILKRDWKTDEIRNNSYLPKDGK